MDKKITEIYGNKVRIRVCGLCWEGDRLLMVNHKLLRSGDFWAPPGGGVEFGESMHDALTREFREETGLQVAVQDLRFACEYIHDTLHSVEMFFAVERVGGVLKAGNDPELNLIDGVAFMSEQVRAGLPPDALHGMVRRYIRTHELQLLNGFHSI